MLDTLDFGPEGVQDIIMEKTGFNVTKAIEANVLSEVAPVEARTRRAAPINAPAFEPIATAEEPEAPVRRTTPKYKISSTFTQ